MSKQFQAVFAENHVLERYSCRKLTTTASELKKCLETLEHPSGWKFTSFHSKIPNESETNKLTRDLKCSLLAEYLSLQNEVKSDEDKEQFLNSDSIHINHFKLRIPPMIFINDIMKIAHTEEEFEKVISLKAEDALLCWIAQHTFENEAKRPVEVLKVPFAKNWTERHLENTTSGFMSDVNNIPIAPGVTSVINSPTTASSDTVPTITPIIGSVFASLPPPVVISTTTAPTGSAKSPSKSGKLLRPYDWTLSSDYCCTVETVTVTSSQENEPEPVVFHKVLNARALSESLITREESSSSNESSTPSSSIKVEVAESSSIDYELLKDRDAPILLYDEFILYQDDLDDSGEVLFEAKLRVMPTCWFLLSKFYLRVDGVLTRCRETRLFHKFTSTVAQEEEKMKGEKEPVVVHMEVLWREAEMTPAATPCADATAEARLSPFGAGASGSKASVHPALLNRGVGLGGAGGAPGMHPALRAAGGGGSGGGGGGFGGVRPVHVLSNAESRNSTHLLPVVNEKEGIHQYFKLIL